ncbi:hypothetical protein Hanom_Chr09g00761601 [Helianthus anomalus]
MPAKLSSLDLFDPVAVTLTTPMSSLNIIESSAASKHVKQRRMETKKKITRRSDFRNILRLRMCDRVQEDVSVEVNSRWRRRTAVYDGVGLHCGFLVWIRVKCVLCQRCIIFNVKVLFKKSRENVTKF